MHVTIASSRDPVAWGQIRALEDKLSSRLGRQRLVRNFRGVAVLIFGCREIACRHAQFRRIRMGGIIPVTNPTSPLLSDDWYLSAVQSYAGPLYFGPECFKEPFKHASGRLGARS